MIVLLCTGSLAFAAIGRPQAIKPPLPYAFPAAAQAPNEGQQTFESRCAGCHGLDGRGGKGGISIATEPRVLRRTDAQLQQIIHDGVPSAGMPAFSTLDDSTAKSLIAYVRLLQGKIGALKLPGDARKGKAIFFGPGKCSGCHMVSGAGGFIASDLTLSARARSAEEIRQAITKPNNAGRLGGIVVVTTKDGQKYSGVLRNADNFSLQLQTLDGAFHLFLKSELQSFERQTAPLMPTDYGSRLSADELNDLVSFLIVSSGKTEADEKAKFREDEENE